MGFLVRMACIRVNKQMGLVKRVTRHVRLVFPLLRIGLVHLGVVTALVSVLKDVINRIVASNVVLLNVSLVVIILMNIVFNVKETYFMLRMVLLKVPAYPKPNALKTI